MLVVTNRTGKRSEEIMAATKAAPECLESWESFDPSKPIIEADEAMANIGLLVEIPDLDRKAKTAEATLGKLRRLKMHRFLTPSVRAAIHAGDTARTALFQNDAFYEAVIFAWAKMADEAIAKAKGIPAKIAAAQAFNCAKADVEIDETTGMLRIPLLKLLEDNNQKGIMYSLTMDWVDKNGSRECIPNPNAPFNVRPDFYLMGYLKDSPAHGHAGRGLACFDRMIGKSEKRIAPERAIELMRTLGLEPGTFQDLFLHLGRPKRHPRTGSERTVSREIFKDPPLNAEFDHLNQAREGIPSGRPIVALAPKKDGFVPAFSRTTGLDISLDEALWDGPGFPRGTRFIVASSALEDEDF